MITIKGTVLGIVFVNEENGYTVVEFEADNRCFTAVGIFPVIGEGEMLALTGEFKENPKFGEQFVVQNVEFVKPDDIDSIKKYLSSGLFRGIGEKLANQIVNYYGSYTMNVIENCPEELIKVSGIGDKKLQSIIESYKQNKEMKESIFFLQKHDITMNLALKIYKMYGDATIATVSLNPYCLVRDIDGVGFFTADKIAVKMGIDKNSPFRIQAALYHLLNEAAAKNGHTCFPENTLTDETAKLLQFDNTEIIKDCLRSMDNVKFINIDNLQMVATQVNFNVEKAIAARLLTLNITAKKWDFDIEKEINIYEKTSGIELHYKQADAVRSVFSNGISVITGGPGTGKTTIIKCITDIMSTNKMKAVLCAPTGRASKRMSESTGMDAKTIHRLLGLEINNGVNVFTYNEIHPLEIDALIVDEISMADIYIFNALVKAVPLGARLIMVGDKDQLPSVSCGNILSDVIGSGLINTVYLTEIYRQAKESMIVWNAHRINSGMMPAFKGATDFFFDEQKEHGGILDAILSMTRNRIPNYLNVSSSDIQVLSPIKKGVIGVENLNIQLQNCLNPNGKEFRYKNQVYREGDKVMQNINNYSLEWLKDGQESGKGVFNGEIGYVMKVEKDKMRVLFDDGKIVRYQGGEIDELSLAYCVSVHKAQGCEFDVVIMAIVPGSYMICTKNLLYTAVTRAKKMVVLIGEESNIRKMVNNNYTAKRYSMLKNFLIISKDKLNLLWNINE